jgi:hypothetical protein
LVPIITCENILQFLPSFSDEQLRLLLRLREEQPPTLPVAANVDATIGAAQAGDGQPQSPTAAPLPTDYGSVIRPVRLVSAAKRGASTHPGILQRRRGNSYLWDASPGVRLWAG